MGKIRSLSNFSSKLSCLQEVSRIQKKKIRRQNKESKIRKRVRNFITFVIFILLIALFLYPAVSNSWNQYRNEKLQTKYEKTVSRDPKKEAIYKKARAYNNRDTENIITKYSVLPQDLTNREYSSYLHVPDTRMMGMIFIPKIDVKLPIYHGTGEYALSNGCGHVKGTSLPVGGKSSNCVLTAHRGLPSAKLFTDINRMKNGDVFYIETMGHALTYHVDSVRTVCFAEKEMELREEEKIRKEGK